MFKDKLLLHALALGAFTDLVPTNHEHGISCSCHHHSKPWDSIQLTKAERKGKTPEEIQVIRKAKYER